MHLWFLLLHWLVVANNEVRRMQKDVEAVYWWQVVDALAGSNVKIAARDVLATWKVLVVLVFAPIVYGFYSWLLFVYMFYYRYPENSLLQITSWSALSWFAQPLLHLVGVKLMETGMDLYK